tara:strand:+ start:129 stop:335 length:207 start_codon:yes stop_codon:yes gene_type:complete
MSKGSFNLGVIFSINQNTNSLIEEVKKGGVTMEDLKETLELAEQENEHEVAISINKVIEMIETGELKI